MRLSNLTFVVTDACNFNCSYCVQTRENKSIQFETIKKAVDFFYPFFRDDETVHIGFYGGEPLLAFDRVKYAVEMVLEKNGVGDKDVVFSLTTNGVLLTDDILRFLDERRFQLMLSFDGLAQEEGRRKGTMEQMVGLVKRIREFQGIDFEINSVFTPRTVSLLSGSMRFMIEPGGPPVTFNLSGIEPWSACDLETLKKELETLSDL